MDENKAGADAVKYVALGWFSLFLAAAPAAAAEVFQRIGALRDSGVPILLVEQNVNLALRVSDRAYILDGGRNAIEGPAAEIRDDPNVRRVYLGGHVDTPNSC